MNQTPRELTLRKIPHICRCEFKTALNSKKKKLLSLLLTLQILLTLSHLGQDNVVGLLLFIMQSKLWCYNFCDKVTERDIIQKNLVFCQTIFIIVYTQSALSQSAVYYSLHSRTSLVRLVFLGYRSLKA